MAEGFTRKIYLNLAVHDLKKTMEFFSKLGFSFNPKFSDENAACMIINEHASVMLLVKSFFRTFTQRQLCDTSKYTEGLFAISCPTRDAVDALVKKAIASGAQYAREPQDHGFMYGWSFYDLDGHHWEVMWMDPKSAT